MKDKRELRRKETGEVFTPDSLLDEMTAMLPEEVWMNPQKTFLDNSCGNGNIILYIIRKKMANGSTYLEALNTVYGLDLMQDNIEECHIRIKDFLNKHNINYDNKEVDKILQHNIVCHNALDWDYENWKSKSKYDSNALF